MQSVVKLPYRWISVLLFAFFFSAAAKSAYMVLYYEKYGYLLLLFIALRLSAIFLRIAWKGKRWRPNWCRWAERSSTIDK